MKCPDAQSSKHPSRGQGNIVWMLPMCREASEPACIRLDDKATLSGRHSKFDNELDFRFRHGSGDNL
jgi:hypothetical protein